MPYRWSTRAMLLLAGDDADRRGPIDDTGGGEGTGELGPPPEHLSAEVVNLKHGRGSIPEDVRAAFREIDSVLELIDALIEPLETSAVRELEDARPRGRRLAPAGRLRRNGSARRATRVCPMRRPSVPRERAG